MKERYRIYRRRNGVYYLFDKKTAKQESLRTSDKVEARRVATARNQAVEQPALNVAMAKAYLAGKSPQLTTRTWEEALNQLAARYKGETADRWSRFAKSAPISPLKGLPIIETVSDHFVAALTHPKAGTSTNVWLRRLHNYALEQDWLLTPVLKRSAWPKIQYQPRLAITEAEHLAILASEQNEERRNYYEMLWLTGGSQDDIAQLTRLEVHTEANLLAYQRKKLKGRGEDQGSARIVIGPALEALLSRLPSTGYLFPRIRREEAKHRSTEFSRRCRVAGVKGRSLHSYRYSWAERACNAGMPEREAMKHLGHRSRAVHRGYALRADAPILPLEYYEQERQRLLEQQRALALPVPKPS